MARPATVALLTDFGYRDGYVGVMKGVISDVCPTATVIDITHGIAPQDIAAASFVLASSLAYFPRDTVHVVVVDPGVGSSRRAVAVRASHATIVCPDNGLLTGVASSFGIDEAFELTNTSLWRPGMDGGPSATFHGRDVFAPVAAHLASGRVSVDSVGVPIAPSSLVMLASVQKPAVEEAAEGGSGARVLAGCVQYIDGYGNLVTNISPKHLEQLSSSGEGLYARVRVSIAGRECSYAPTYAAGGKGAMFWLCASHGFVEIAVGCGSAAETTSAAVGARVVCSTVD